MTNHQIEPTPHILTTPTQRWYYVQTHATNPLAHTLFTHHGRYAWVLVETQLAKHPFLQERSTFPHRYTHAIWYNILTHAYQHNALPTRSLHQLTQTLRLPHETVRSWLYLNKIPRLQLSINKLDTAYQRVLNSYPQEALQHHINPSKVYILLKQLHDTPTNSPQRLQQIATVIRQLHATHPSEDTVVFAELRPYHKNGPKWLYSIAHEIQHHLNDIQCHLSTIRNSKMLRIGIENSILYIWEKDTDSDNWLNIFARELFYFQSPNEKRNLVETARRHLLLQKQSVSRLIGQLTDHSRELYSSTSRVQALHFYHPYLYGASLHFLLNVTGHTLADINIERIGRGSQGYGSIYNPRFPLGEALHEFRARALAVMLSDGSLEPSGILRYTDESTSRIAYVKNLFCSSLGKIDTKVYTNKDKASTLRFPAVVGRIMQKWGMPVGDKFLQSFVLPTTVLNGSIRVKCAYLEEVIPEDGSFGVYGSKTLFRIGRSVVLDAGDKTTLYNFKSKIPRQLKEVFTHLATKNPDNKKLDSIAHYEMRLTWGKLKDASKSKKNTLLIENIKKLIELVLGNPPKLLLGERRVLSSLGIKTRMFPKFLTLYSSGRLSVSWELMTSGREEAKKWALLAPPSSGYKQRDVEEWLTSYGAHIDEVSVD